MFEFKPDFETVMNRYEAWWNCAIVDRPLFSLNYLKDFSAHAPWPLPKEHATAKERWLDIEYLVESADAAFKNVVYFGDALPIVWPNLGPEVFAAFYGCPLEFGDTTSWSVPILGDWRAHSLAQLQLDRSNFYFKKLLEITDALLELGKDRFIVGYTDMHGGGDAIAAFRDPAKLCLDLIDHPQAVKKLNNRITTDFLEIYDSFHEKLAAAGMPSTTWLGATCRGKYHVPSADFSALISANMFTDFFLEGIVRECRHMDRNIYHLDGPNALRFLDLLLDIPEIHAIQWVAGAGRDYWGDWIDVYKRIQKAGKGFCVDLSPEDLDSFTEVFRPEGVWLNILNVADKDVAATVMKKVTAWRN